MNRIARERAGYRGDDMPQLSDAELVERAIDMMEQGGMVLEPWQATAFRVIMLHKPGLRRAPRS